MSVYTSTYTATYGGGGPVGGTVVNQWSGAFSRSAVSTEPSLGPLDLALDATTSVGGGSGVPTAGNWLFAISAWRQDTGTAGTLQYPSTVNIRDDVHNFWIPVSVVAPETGIVRTSVWMAPAVREPAYVFASPTAYQAAVTLTILEVEADCPWYSVAATVAASTNQGTSVTASQDPASGLFSVGVIAYDLNTLTVTFTHTGWTEQTPVVTSASGHSADLTMTPFTAATTGSSMTLSASGTGGNADWAEVLITVHGVSDAIAFPYQGLLQMENWPALITEMACGQTLNANWSFAAGVSPWTGSSNATLAASGLFTFGNSPGSMVITPDGSTAQPGAKTEEFGGVVPGVAYAMAAWVTVPAGWASGVQIGVDWFTSGGSFISSSFQSPVTVTGSQQQLVFSAIAPATAAKGQMFAQFQGTPAATNLMYVAYAAAGIPNAYGNIPDDQIQWIDVSSRTITQEGTRIARGIQYEQQSLEAGTLEIALANNDGAFTQGNQQSPYYPAAGDDDVPIRVRAIWPPSITPYSVLFSGFTDEVKPQWSDETQYGYVTITAADCWSRLTAQMLTAVQQEFLADIATGGTGAYWPCNDNAGAAAAANIAPTSIGPLVLQRSKGGQSPVTQAFADSTITLAGDPGGTGWAVAGYASGGIAKGYSLILFPPDPSVLPPITGGVTVEFFVAFAARVSSINWNGSVAACVNAKGRVWEMYIGEPGGANDGQLLLSVYDKTTGAATSTVIDGSSLWGTTHFISMQFTESTWQVYEDGDTAANGSCNFSAVYNGFSFNGYNVPYAGLSGAGFNGTLQDIALYPELVPQSRVFTQNDIAITAAQDELDVERIARVTGYGGFTPPLAMRCLTLSDLFSVNQAGPSPDVDPVTQITDTVGQVVSDYDTNIAASTLAAMFIDGPGALVYRRRLEWYNRTQGQWVLGELAPLALNTNPYFSSTVSSWTATNATLAWVSGQGQFNGSGAAQLTASGGGAVSLVPENQPAAPGEQFSCVVTVRCPAGYASGAFVSLAWLNSGLSAISSVLSSTVPLVAGAWTWLIVTGTAPAGTAWVRPSLVTNGTPSASTVFTVDSVVTADYPGEAPYLRDVRLSDDRAQMFNAAVLDQSGTGTKTTFAGASFDFSPSSGITVTDQNAASVAERGNVPYTATIYLQNTLAAVPNIPADGAIEDLASWIVNTLGTPVLRGEQAVLTPGATWQAMITALQAEVGDTVTLWRRPIGAPALSLLNYVSHIEHEIDVREGWTTTYEVSPAPVATILACDDPELGVLDGNNLLGW